MFIKNNYVAVVGSSLGDPQEKNKLFFDIAKIIEIGKYELIVNPIEGSYRRCYRVSKKSCISLNPSQIKTHVPMAKPNIGDVVMYYEYSWMDKKQIKKIGILVGIIDKPGEVMKGNILHDNKYEELPYDNLMVIQQTSDCDKK